MNHRPSDADPQSATEYKVRWAGAGADEWLRRAAVLALSPELVPTYAKRRRKKRARPG